MRKSQPLPLSPAERHIEAATQNLPFTAWEPPAGSVAPTTEQADSNARFYEPACLFHVTRGN